MPSDSCLFCSGDLTVVEGIMGPQLFCPSCRRFQAPSDAHYPRREPADERLAAESGGERSEKHQISRS